jgi:hypothetical protein
MSHNFVWVSQRLVGTWAAVRGLKLFEQLLSKICLNYVLTVGNDDEPEFDDDELEVLDVLDKDLKGLV